MNAAPYTPADEAELARILSAHYHACEPLDLYGGGTLHRQNPGRARGLSSKNLTGILSYEPGELTLIARAGTSMAEINLALAAQGQTLAFEPMDLRRITGAAGEPSLGGVIASNNSGPRRLRSGACRDHLLGLRFVDGQGRVIKAGGRVMKNVTGLDLPKLLCGAYGTLGMITEVALKTMPLPEAEVTLIVPDLTASQAVTVFATSLATPFEISAASWQAGSAYLRIEGLQLQVDYRIAQLRGLFPGQQISQFDAVESQNFWRESRDLQHLKGDDPLWRVYLKPSDAPALIAALQPFGGQVSLDWGGGLLWYRGTMPPATMRALPNAQMAQRICGPDGPDTPPQAPEVAAINARIKQVFDPHNILNPAGSAG